MKAWEIIEALFADAEKADYTNTCDTIKAGDPNKEVKKIGVTMTATPNVIQMARNERIDLLIVHEPTYYNHMDEHSDDPLEVEKRQLLESTGIVVYRYHDHAHCTVPDVIHKGMVEALELDGDIDFTFRQVDRLILHQSITAVELAKLFEQKLCIRHPRICGSREKNSNVISLLLGASGQKVLEELRRSNSQIVITGETREWSVAEYARDADQLGHNKTLIILGHLASERDGMKYVRNVLAAKYPELEVKYFESEEVYSYAD